MAWTTDPYHYSRDPGRFFGPKYIGFQKTDGLPAVANNEMYQNFYRELVESSGGKSPYVFTGGATPNLRFTPTTANGSTGYHFTNYGHNFNSDEREELPYPLRANRFVNNASMPHAEKAGHHPLGASGSDAVFLNPTYYDVTTQDYGRKPADTSGGLDAHFEAVSQRTGSYVMLIKCNTNDRLNRYNKMLKINNRWVDGSFCYEVPLRTRELYEATIGHTGTGRFANRDALHVDDHPYGIKSAFWSVGSFFYHVWTNEQTEDSSTLGGYGDFGGGTASRFLTVDCYPTYEEFERGIIPHMLFATCINGAASYVPPAYGGDGNFIYQTDPVYWNGASAQSASLTPYAGASPILAPKYGWIVRITNDAYLRASRLLDASEHVGAPFAKTFLRCLREYGAQIGDKNTGTLSTFPLVQIGDITPYVNRGWVGGGSCCMDVVMPTDCRFPLIWQGNDTTDAWTKVLYNPLVDGVPTPIAYHDSGGNAVDAMEHALENIAQITASDLEFVDVSSLLKKLDDGITPDPYSWEIA